MKLKYNADTVSKIAKDKITEALEEDKDFTDLLSCIRKYSYKDAKIVDIGMSDQGELYADIEIRYDVEVTTRDFEQDDGYICPEDLGDLPMEKFEEIYAREKEDVEDNLGIDYPDDPWPKDENEVFKAELLDFDLLENGEWPYLREDRRYDCLEIDGGFYVKAKARFTKIKK